ISPLSLLYIRFSTFSTDFMFPDLPSFPHDALPISLVYVLTEGGPGGRTMLPMLFTYLEAFKNRNIGYAAAMGVVLVIVVVLLLAIYLRSQFRSEKES